MAVEVKIELTELQLLKNFFSKDCSCKNVYEKQKTQIAETLKRVEGRIKQIKEILKPLAVSIADKLDEKGNPRKDWLSRYYKAWETLSEQISDLSYCKERFSQCFGSKGQGNVSEDSCSYRLNSNFV